MPGLPEFGRAELGVSAHTPGARSPTARTLCDRLGIDATVWRTTIGEGGLFQGVAVGNRTARMAFAATQGKQTIADKTGLWAES